MRAYVASSLDFVERLPKVGDQVVGVLDADRVADQAFGNAHRGALVGVQFDMAGGGGGLGIGHGEFFLHSLAIDHLKIGAGSGDCRSGKRGHTILE
jgi:hypothetical protein